MRKARQIFWVAGVEFRKFLTVKNFILMLFSLIFLGESVVSKMAAVSQETGIRLNILEPVNLIFSYSFHAMIIPIVFIVLLSNFPDRSSGGIFMMARIRRRTWLLGQIVFAILAGAFYLCILLAGSMLWIRGTGELSNQWSDFMTSLYLEYPDVYARNTQLFLEAGTVTQGRPVGVFLVSCVLMLCYLAVLAQLLILFSLVKWKRIGLFFNIGLTIFGAVAVFCLGRAKWIFPLAHSIFGIHFVLFFAKPELPLRYSVLYYGALNAVLFLVNSKLAGKCHIGDDWE